MPPRKTSSSTSTAPLQSRVADLRKRISKWRCDAILITNPRDVRYLTGFVGDDSWAIVTATGGKVTILSDSRFDEEIDRFAPQAKKIIRKSTVSLSQALDDELPSGQRSVAIQETYITLALKKALEEKVKGVTFVAVDDGMMAQRAVKDKSEVAEIRKAVAIQQQALRNTLAHLKPGMTELQVAAYLEYQMMDLGAEQAAFQSIIGACANSSLPHYRPGQAKIQNNNIVLVDWGAKHEGYCSDMTRVVALGKMPAKIREIYKVVLEAQLAAIAAIKPGAVCKDVDKAAREVIKKAGYDKQFQHGLGHGIGLNVHESPRFGPNSEGELVEGHVVTVEPGIYLPGIGGIRLEDDVLVTKKGHEVLCDLPKDLESAII
ncbi:MAG: aminopeptidase P family protein [Phycisphaeraceae bacterium]